MGHIIVISKNIQPKLYNVELLVPNGTGDKAHMSVGKEFGVDIQAARKEAKRLADIYGASIEDRSED